MQDSEKVYRIELTNEEYEYLENLKNEYYEKLSKMTKEERLQYFRDNYCNEQKLNFEKKINSTIYKVNTHFDVNAEESNSIKNQKSILSNYAKDNHFINTKFFVDDGYSGTSFTRSAFVEMMELADNGQISTIIVKDHSRFMYSRIWNSSNMQYIKTRKSSNSKRI